MYVVHLDDAAPTAWFVVRGSAARSCCELATNTWNAYNDDGGPNLYTGAGRAVVRPAAGAGDAGQGRHHAAARRAGLRPLDARPGPDDVARHGRLGRAGAAVRALGRGRRASSSGYATNADLEQHPDVLDGCRLLLSVGHDEYWTWGMRDTVEAFVAGGGNVAFLSGNTCYWQVRIEGDVMVGYKHRHAEDPVQSDAHDDDVGGPDHRPAGDRADRRDVHPRRLPPHRLGRARTAPAATRSTAPTTGCSRAPGCGGATSSAPTSASSATSATAAS